MAKITYTHILFLYSLELIARSRLLEYVYVRMRATAIRVTAHYNFNKSLYHYIL